MPALLYAAGLAAALAAFPAAIPAASAEADLAAAAATAPPGPAARVEARSAALLAVGVARGDTMSIHVSRLIDNVPVRDAVVTVMLRGAAHATTPEADGSYTLKAGDLQLPGAAGVEFRVTQAGAQQILRGTLVVDGAAAPEAKSSGRQLWWWALNFGVCIGFLYLLSRRRRSAQD